MTLRVGGLTPLSTTDWPGMLAAVVFCQGCPWRCRYCHNPGLIPARGENEIPWDDVLAFLRRRQGLLDGVVFSGGEPTLQPGLADAMREVRALGFRVGLHTGGAYPRRLAEVLPLVDWVGLDAKAPFADYPRITGVAGSGERARSSLERVLASGVAHDIRTTVHPALLADADVVNLAQDLSAHGVKHYVIQAFRSQGCADAALIQDARRERPLASLVEDVAGLFQSGH
ncbi:MAG: anaerobic ribonucleoside-triphosphate reductase activating protein [Thiobacillus sp.]